MQVNVEDLYERINHYTVPVLILLHRNQLRCVAARSGAFKTLLESKANQDRILGVYDYMVTKQQLREDLHHRGVTLI